MSEQPEEVEPERTPENSLDIDALWQKAELALKEERAKQTSDAWSSYRGLSSRSAPLRAPLRAPLSFDRHSSDGASKDDSLEDLWKEAELEIHRRRAMAQKGKGFRVYDISDGKGKGSKGSKGFKGSKGYPEMPRVYPSKSAENSWKDTLQKQGRCWKILLSRRQIDDRILMHWCKWAQTHLERLPPKAVISQVDLSFNQISAVGLEVLLQTLSDADVPVEAMSLHHNVLNDAAANQLAQYLHRSQYTLYELRLSHNQISELGARSLLESAVKALQSPSELLCGSRPTVRYPCDRQGQLVPLFLCLSNNRIGFGRSSKWVQDFLESMEHELLTTRRQVSQTVSDDPWGSLAPRPEAKLFCEALGGFGCHQSRCTQMHPELPGLPPGPAVHLPMFDQQDTRRELRQGPREGHDRSFDRGFGRHGRPGRERGFDRRRGGAMHEAGSRVVPGAALTRSVEQVDLLDLDWEPPAAAAEEAPDEGDSRSTGGMVAPGAPVVSSKSGKGATATLLEELTVSEGPEVVLHAGSVVKVLYEGSEDLDDEGYLFVSIEDWEGWIPANVVQY